MSGFLSNIATSLGFNKVQEVHQSTKAKNAKEESLNKDGFQSKSKDSQSKKSFRDVLNEAQDKVSISNEGKQSIKKSIEDKKVNEVNEDEPEIKEKPLLCNHDPNAENTTLVILPKRIMSYPPEVFMCCDICRMGFRFVKNEDGSFTSKT